MNIHLTGVSGLVEVEGNRKWKGSEDLKASLPLPLKKSASHRFRFRFHITGLYYPLCGSLATHLLAPYYSGCGSLGVHSMDTIGH